MIWAEEYLTFVAKESGTFTLTIGSAVSRSILSSISYSTDNGKTWNTTNNVDSQTVTITTPTINEGDKVLWKGIGTGVSTTINNNNRPSTSSIFSSSGEFNVEGNIMSLIYDDDFINKKSVQGTYNFALLFYSNNMPNTAKVVSARNMVLPVSAVSTCCYLRMFQGCPALEEAPLSIDATSINEQGCMSMFYGCINLITTPELPATTLATNCYSGIFQGCTSLTTAPELPATTLASYCYQYMFYGCTNLVNAPVLPATTLTNYCYAYMFQNCTNLTTAPELSATTLADHCCYSMFSFCTSLINVPSLSATTLATACYASMFQGCTSLTTAPELPATTLASNCYNYMFQNCTNLNYIKAMFTTTPSTTYTQNWVNGVAASGTFVKNSAATWTTTGNNGVPTNWTVQTASE